MKGDFPFIGIPFVCQFLQTVKHQLRNASVISGQGPCLRFNERVSAQDAPQVLVLLSRLVSSKPRIEVNAN